MNLQDCKLGGIVQEFTGTGSVPTKRGRIGHIVGLTMNQQDNPEVIPVVRWASNPPPGYTGEASLLGGEVQAIHHNNLTTSVLDDPFSRG
jgi:hypothetical protein